METIDTANPKLRKAFGEVLSEVQEKCHDCPTALMCIEYGARTIVEDSVSVEEVKEVIAQDIELACEKGWQVYSGPDPEIAGVCHYGGDRRPFFKSE